MLGLGRNWLQRAQATLARIHREEGDSSSGGSGGQAGNSQDTVGLGILRITLITSKLLHLPTHAGKGHSMWKLEVTFNQRLISIHGLFNQRRPLELQPEISWLQ